MDRRPTRRVGRRFRPPCVRGGAIYGLGIFGAWVWFFQQADTFWEYVLAVFQGVFWPPSWSMTSFVPSQSDSTPPQLTSCSGKAPLVGRGRSLRTRPALV